MGNEHGFQTKVVELPWPCTVDMVTWWLVGADFIGGGGRLHWRRFRRSGRNDAACLFPKEVTGTITVTVIIVVCYLLIFVIGRHGEIRIKDLHLIILTQGQLRC